MQSGLLVAGDGVNQSRPYTECMTRHDGIGHCTCLHQVGHSAICLCVTVRGKPTAPVIREAANPHHVCRTGPFYPCTAKHIANTMHCLGPCVLNSRSVAVLNTTQAVSKLVPVHGPHFGSAPQFPIHKFYSRKTSCLPLSFQPSSVHLNSLYLP